MGADMACFRDAALNNNRYKYIPSASLVEDTVLQWMSVMVFQIELTSLFVQQLIYANNKEYIKATYYWFYMKASHRWTLYLPPKGRASNARSIYNTYHDAIVLCHLSKYVYRNLVFHGGQNNKIESLTVEQKFFFLYSGHRICCKSNLNLLLFHTRISNFCWGCMQQTPCLIPVIYSCN